ncbi:MFS transporter [Trinickia dabaoshanensis]|uniref:MFS transporter n=1 Tax=Trinickia dabaoshanensis TaxID=564714 RepID=A0A2N7VIU7_9BURK|nr:MFS transporter [Trinickia dabaoshanensis]PMS17070.1 MFS transporter [Trinickia dabaoshanensis]
MDTCPQRALPQPAAGRHGVPILLFATLVGVAVLPLYASQVMLGALDASLHLRAWTTLVTALTMLGYAVGLVALVPLVDRLPNRPLIGATLAAQALFLAVAALAPAPIVFLFASLAIGITASAIQMLVPAAAALAPVEARGAVVGNVMSGLMLGILLSRPLASIVTRALGWRGFFLADAALLALVAACAVPRLPALLPAGKPSYRVLIASLGRLVVSTQTLRRHALYQALLMTGFNMFWTSVAVVLARAPFHCSAEQIAVFALAGAGGALAAPIAGHAADRGHARRAKQTAHVLAIAAIVIAAWALTAPLPRTAAIGIAAAAAFLLDAGVIADQALGRRAINLLAPESRGRVNGLFTGLFFIGGAVGAALSGPTLASMGWLGVSAVTLVVFTAAASIHQTHRDRTPS